MTIQPFLVDDSVTEEGDIEWKVKRLCNNRSGRTSRIRAEHIKRWITETRRAEK